MTLQLEIVHCPGIALDSLGGYFAGLGLLSALSPHVLMLHACWREDQLALLAPGISGDRIERLLLETWLAPEYPRNGNEAAWSKIQKADTKAKTGRGVAALRSNLPSGDLRFLDSHLVSISRNVFNPVFGTGGNIGKRNLTKLAADSLAIVRSGPHAQAWLRGTLWAEACDLPELPSSGTWFPHANKTYNSGLNGFFREGRLSPWLFLLALEGALLMRGGPSRRLSAMARAYATYPFVSGGFSPLSEQDVGLKRAGQFWAPIWEHPASLPDIQALLQRGLARVGKRSATAPHEFVIAALAAATDAGISRFAPFDLRETTSQQTYEALMGATIVVSSSAADRKSAELLAALITWINRLPFEPHDGKKKGHFSGFRGPIERLIEEIGTAPDDAAAWQALLLSLAEAQRRIDQDRTRKWRERCVALPLLSLDWLARLWPEGFPIEVRIACGIASLGGGTYKPLLTNVFGVELDRDRRPFFPKNRPSRAVWSDAEPTIALIDILKRRLIDFSGKLPATALGRWPLEASYAVSCDEVALFLTGQLDDYEIARWLPALSLLDWCELRWPSVRHAQVADGLQALDALFRPLVTSKLNWPKAALTDTQPKTEYGLRLVTLLAAGDAEAACDLALARYRALGLRPVATPEVGLSPASCERLSAALLIPVDTYSVERGRKTWILPDPDEEQQ